MPDVTTATRRTRPWSDTDCPESRCVYCRARYSAMRTGLGGAGEHCSAMICAAGRDRTTTDGGDGSHVTLASARRDLGTIKRQMWAEYHRPGACIPELVTYGADLSDDDRADFLDALDLDDDDTDDGDASFDPSEWGDDISPGGDTTDAATTDDEQPAIAADEQPIATSAPAPAPLPLPAPARRPTRAPCSSRAARADLSRFPYPTPFQIWPADFRAPRRVRPRPHHPGRDRVTRVGHHAEQRFDSAGVHRSDHPRPTLFQTWPVDFRATRTRP